MKLTEGKLRRKLRAKAKKQANKAIAKDMKKQPYLDSMKVNSSIAKRANNSAGVKANPVNAKQAREVIKATILSCEKSLKHKVDTKEITIANNEFNLISNSKVALNILMAG
jgi:hypothetical protein